jgi:hypothetical protein
MAIPRRFYYLFLFSAFALLSTFLFLNRSSYPLSVPAQLSDGWTGRLEGGAKEGETAIGFDEAVNGKTVGDEHDGNGLLKAPTPTPLTPKPNTPTPDDSKEEDHGVADKISANIAIAIGGIPEAAPIPQPSSIPRKELRVSVVESGGENEEVAAAMIYAFGRQPLSPISLYLFEQRFQMGDIIGEFNLSSPIVANKTSRDFADSVSGPTYPQLLVSASCELDLVKLSDSFEALVKTGKTYLFCIVHDAGQWAQGELVDKVRPWVQQQMVSFVTLSAHTAHHLRAQAIANWEFNATVTVQWIPPVFPVDIPDPPAEKDAKITNDFSYALYGDSSPAQNNYTDIFTSLEAVLEQAKNVTNDMDTQHARNIMLHLLGRGPRPDIPSALAAHVDYNPTLTYKQYYTLLSRVFALVPYLPLPDFLTRAASQAIPAALIAGAPLVASDELLDAYSYIEHDAVWISTRGEGEMDTVTRVVQWSAEEHRRKRTTVRLRTKRLYERNAEIVEQWVLQAQMKIDRTGWRMKSLDKEW